MQIITNVKRAKTLSVWYSVFAVLGLLFFLIGTPFFKQIAWALLFNAANGFLCFAFFRKLRLNGFVKFVLFVIGVIVICSLYKNADEIESEILSLLSLFTNVIGVLTLGVSRLILAKTKTYYILNFIIFPISIVASLIFSLFELIFGIVIMVILIGIVVIFVWYSGVDKYRESSQYHYEIHLSNGVKLQHTVDNNYIDGSGRSYLLSSDGRTLYEL